ncbi:hypothetical protein [Ruegeria sp. SCP11]|uniref:hypothetical protein n=1 Tax=Ruegeria sp. SCP11 TaxID=3141378 RepID=UPI00333541A7
MKGHDRTLEVSPEPLNRAVERICQSKEFRGSSFLGPLLRYLVGCATGNVGQKATAQSIAVEVFGLGADFRSKSNSRVRVATSRLRTALEIYDRRYLPEVSIILHPGSYVPDFSLREFEPTEVTKGLMLADWYQCVASEQAHAIVQHRLSKLVEIAPEDPSLLAAYADAMNDGYKHGFDAHGAQLDHAEGLVERALQLDPRNPRALMSSAFVALERNEYDKVHQCGRALMEIGDEASETNGQWMLDILKTDGPVESVSLSVATKSDETPGWMNHNLFVAAYRRGDYETALVHAVQFGMPLFFWSSIERAAAMAQLGLMSASKLELQRLTELNPLFARNPTKYLSSYIPYQDDILHVLEGLEKAGLRTSK